MAVPTLKVIASVLHLHGPDATITSDNQGIEALLGDIRARIAEQRDLETPWVQLARVTGAKFGKATTIFRKGAYGKTVYGPQFKKIIL